MTIKKMVLHYISACVLLTIVIGLWNTNRMLAQIIGIAALCDLVITSWKASRHAKLKKDWWQQEVPESYILAEQMRAENARERQVWEKEQAEYNMKEEAGMKTYMKSNQTLIEELRENKGARSDTELMKVLRKRVKTMRPEQAKDIIGILIQREIINE